MSGPFSPQVFHVAIKRYYQYHPDFWMFNVLTYFRKERQWFRGVIEENKQHGCLHFTKQIPLMSLLQYWLDFCEVSSREYFPMNYKVRVEFAHVFTIRILRLW